MEKIRNFCGVPPVGLDHRERLIHDCYLLVNVVRVLEQFEQTSDALSVAPQCPRRSPPCQLSAARDAPSQGGGAPSVTASRVTGSVSLRPEDCVLQGRASRFDNSAESRLQRAPSAASCLPPHFGPRGFEKLRRQSRHPRHGYPDTGAVWPSTFWVANHEPGGGSPRHDRRVIARRSTTAPFEPHGESLDSPPVLMN